EHHGQADGLARVAAGGAGHQSRTRRDAQGAAADAGQDAQRAAHRPTQIAADYRLTTAVLVPRSCRPPKSLPVNSAGITNCTRMTRTSARPRPTCCRSSTDTTRSPKTNWPGVNWYNRTATVPNRTKVTATATDPIHEYKNACAPNASATTI